VRRYAQRLAAGLGLDLRSRRRLSLAAKLHDIGKVAIPETILNKRGPLTPEEFGLVQEHPVIGERILAPIIRSRMVLAAIRGHHEALDGTGYPDGLCGERIPLLARIITIADCFDAMTSSRAYRGALPVAEALDNLRAGAGKRFEAAFVRTFIECVVTPDILAATPLPA
jgi:HD-GYP domain-containing protein (c-di-GMP phosphodiesterase class II)